ncbi:MAG: heat shock 70 family protein [Myxococcota bacterium]|jgi:molecular chaperone DnaK|nr:heat shock 70 family protein [Myxococcota bacterium]
MTSARVRIRWEARPSVDYVVRSAKGRSIRFESDGALPPPGTKGAFELRDVDGRTIAEGTLQLAFVQGSEAGAQVIDGHKVVVRPKSVDVALDDLPVPELPVPEDLPPATTASETSRSAGSAADEASVIVEPDVPRESRPESDEGRVARVATRIRGKGASEGFTIGIDLGTSNTCVSIVENGRPRVLPTRTGASTVPSVLAIVDGQVRVGQAAAKRLVLNPQETIYGSKRLVGRAYSEALADEFQPYFAFPLVETDDHQFGARLPDRVVSFEEVAERLLREVREVAAEHLNGSVDRAVVTVPAYFGEAQRDAVRRAARKAGLTVPRVVAEPTAAAVAYGYGRKERATLVVFDLGGGTFDVSILKIEASRFEVLATGGDAFLGGIDVDDLLANHLASAFKRAERLDGFEPDATQIARLREAAEQCKKGLSVQKKFSVSLPHFAMIDGSARTLAVNVTQEELFELTRAFCERLVAITQDTLEKAKLQTYSVDDVLLVGGSTRLPQVQEAVEKIFGRPPSKRINPDEAVAIGAAILAQESASAVELVDVLPLSIGFSGDGRRYMRLIPRNTPVPSKRSFVVRTTSEGQLTYRMPLFQGERKDAVANEYLGTLVVENIPTGPKGRQIELSLGLDPQCFLEMSAVDVESGRALDVKISRASSVAEVTAALGPYEGPVEAPERPRAASPLGWFFSRLRGLFGKR